MKRRPSLRRASLHVFLCWTALASLHVFAKPERHPEPLLRDWPMFGGSSARNMVNLQANKLPADWGVEEGKERNVKWSAKIGSGSMFGSPVVAEGKVFVATNNSRPRDVRVKGDSAVLMAFAEKDGRFLWQITHDYPDHPAFLDSRTCGLLSTPTCADGKLYYTTPACEVICADCKDGNLCWTYDMMKELKVVPRHANLCSPLVYRDLLFAVTGNGRDEEDKLPAADAPSFVALNRKTGKLVWQSKLPGNNIIAGQWSSPALAIVKDAAQVIFAGGDGVLYSFEPETGKLIWKCDCLPERKKIGGREIDNYFVGSPVIVKDRLYLGMGHQPEGVPTKWSYFLCVDVTKRGDVSLKSYDRNAPENKVSALVWAFGGLADPVPVKGRKVRFGTTLSTAAVHDGLVYIPEETGYLHCLDANTGHEHWMYDFKANTWGSAYYADGRIFVGCDSGEIFVFAHGRARNLLTTIEMEGTIHTTPIAADGVLYVATRSKLYAIGER